MTMRILVIDDDDGVRVTLEHMLRSWGCEVTSADSSRQGLELAKKLQPELIMTDLIMPDNAGAEIIVSLKRTCPNVRVVAMSGGARLGNANILREAKENGADYILPKPFERDQLRAALGLT